MRRFPVGFLQSFIFPKGAWKSWTRIHSQPVTRSLKGLYLQGLAKDKGMRAWEIAVDEPVCSEMSFGPSTRRIYSLQIPMTPQAKRAPAFPVDFESSWPPSPKSSTSAWTTTVRPKIELLPIKEICLSAMSTVARPAALAVTFPRSPAWRIAWVGPPCSFPFGLKWGPALMHPFVPSPNSWIWKPWRPAFKPSIEPVTLTASDSD